MQKYANIYRHIVDILCRLKKTAKICEYIYSYFHPLEDTPCIKYRRWRTYSSWETSVRSSTCYALFYLAIFHSEISIFSKRNFDRNLVWTLDHKMLKFHIFIPGVSFPKIIFVKSFFRFKKCVDREKSDELIRISFI